MIKGKKDVIEVDGIVIERLPGAQFLVEVDVNGKKVNLTGYLSGKMRVNYINIVEGDKVRMEVTPYDKTRGRITYRYK